MSASTADLPQRIVLIGLSGSGKTAVGRRIAERLTWNWGDSDDLIASRAGRSVPAIFREEGETAFRALEREAIADLAGRERVVIATGGGAVLDAGNRRVLWDGAFVVHLDAPTVTILDRLATTDGDGAGRPLLAGEDRRARLDQLRAERAQLYAMADWTVTTGGLSVDEVADEVISAWQRRSTVMLARPGREEAIAGEGHEHVDDAADDEDLAAAVQTPGGSYAAYVGWDVLRRLPGWLKDAGLGPVLHVIADRRVADIHGGALMNVLAEGGFEPVLHAIEMSESRKSLDVVEDVYSRLAADRAERKHTIVAFGGGVATDMGGFVAATYLRGMPLVHVSTSLLGMVDAAIGGKVAVNLREGKNLVGAFYQPRMVVADAALLATLPRREYISGWAEVIKHALIMDAELLGWLEDDAEALLALEHAPLVRALRRSIALKARVVSADEREDGVRMTLNYGHTIGHALEAASGYETLLHGEAVAIGMRAAAYIAHAMGLIDAALVERQQALIRRFGLPASAPGIDVERVRTAMALDKKVVGRALRFVLLAAVGRTVIRTDVPAALVDEAVRLVTAAEAG